MVDATRCLDTAPIWVQLAGYVPNEPRLSGTSRADLVIVGGGLSGLATAYFVAKAWPGMKITILEAGRIGSGATGGSTGIVGPGLKMSIRRLRKTYGDQIARVAFEASQQGVNLLREIIYAEQIDCDARDEPHTLAAITPRQRDRMAAHLADLDSLGYRIEWLGEEELVRRAGPGYVAGFSYDNVLLVDPYRLAMGLAKAVRELGVDIHEHSRVLEMRTTGSAATTLSTTSADITADRVLLAMDGYSGKLEPFRRSVIPIRAHVMATAPLTDQQCAGLGWNGRGGIIDQRNYFNYYRMTADHRLVFGGGPVVVPTGDPVPDSRSADAVQVRLRREMAARFPVLRNIPVVARWKSLAGSTEDRLPIVATVPGMPGVHYAGAWCGHGLSLSVHSAWRFSELLWGQTDSHLLPWTKSRGIALPRPALELGSRLYVRLLDLADKYDVRTGAARTPAETRAIQPAESSTAARRMEVVR